MNRKRVILAALLGLFALCLGYAYLATPRLEKAPPRAVAEGSRRASPAGEASAQAGAERINFGFLRTETESLTDAKRDIFRLGRRSPVRHPEAGVAPAPTATTEVPAVLMPVPVEVVQQALGRFTFLGFLEKDRVKTVFLSSSGTLFLVKKGETFGTEQEFSVVDIEKNLLQVRHAGREGLIEIPLIEKQKLSASVSAPVTISREAVAPLPAGNAQGFRPQRRSMRPGTPQEGTDLQQEQVPQELIEEYNPEERQETNEPVKEDVIEGEANGKNQ